MSEPIRAALLFLINTLIDLYLYVLIIRIILVWTHANYFNPFVQFIVKLTDFIVKPLRRYLPNYKGIEVASIAVIVLLEFFKFILIFLITVGFIHISGLFLLVIGDLLKLVIQIFSFAIIAAAVLSWVQPYSPLSHTLMQFTAPIMRPIQRVIPPIGGVDISPIPALIILQLLLILIVNPIMTYGAMLAVS